MVDRNSHVIYIGKAKNLFNRLSTYFKSGTHDQKTTAMLSRVVDFEYFVCKTESDALGLEANLIKRHKPHYNVLLKDNKTFPYIRIIGSKIEITRHINKSGKFFGPYFNGIWASGLLDTLYDVFGVRDDMGKSPVADATPPFQKGELIENVKSFLRGDKDFGAREILTQKMQQASEMQQFELAIRYRNGLRFLDKLKERTITNVSRDVNCDVFACVSRVDIFVVSVITVRAGKLIGVQNFSAKDDSPKDDDGKLEEFIGQYYLDNVRPDQVITAAQKGYKKHLLDMASQNANEYLDTSIEKINFKTAFTMGACEELKTVLGISVTPKKIECFDISHMGGENVVASMVTFIDGVQEKKLYRKFRIKHGQGNDDYLSMHEVLNRRLNRLGGIDPSFGIAPDLIIVDGGKGQLSSVTNLTDIPIIAFSENNEIFTQSDQVIRLDKHSYALRLLQRIRDEAHRFAVGYQTKTRGNKP